MVEDAMEAEAPGSSNSNLLQRYVGPIALFSEPMVLEIHYPGALSLMRVADPSSKLRCLHLPQVMAVMDINHEDESNVTHFENEN